MRKTLLALTLTTLMSPAMAIENGTPENAADYPSLVEMDCTGTLIAGKWLLTAKHCTSPGVGGIRPVNLVGAKMADGGTIATPVQEVEFTGGEISDVELWELSEAPHYDKVLFFSNDPVSQDQGNRFTSYGFGETYPQLNSATFRIDDTIAENAEMLYVRPTTTATTAPGDSGGPILTDGKIIAVIHGLTSTDSRGTAATRIAFVQDWILETVNAWHYPTIAQINADQSVSIEVQSLHQDTVVDNATVTRGNLEIDVDNSSCVANSAQVQPYDICTYTLRSVDGYEATLNLGNDQVITINPGQFAPVTPPTPEPEAGGDSGGSLGWLGLIGLLGLACRRLKK